MRDDNFPSSCRKFPLNFFPFALFSVFLTARITTVTLKYFLVQCQCFKRRDAVYRRPTVLHMSLSAYQAIICHQGLEGQIGVMALPLSPLDFTGISSNCLIAVSDDATLTFGEPAILSRYIILLVICTIFNSRARELTLCHQFALTRNQTMKIENNTCNYHFDMDSGDCSNRKIMIYITLLQNKNVVRTHE